jgi:hypothetical protein
VRVASDAQTRYRISVRHKQNRRHLLPLAHQGQQDRGTEMDLVREQALARNHLLHELWGMSMR